MKAKRFSRAGPFLGSFFCLCLLLTWCAGEKLPVQSHAGSLRYPVVLAHGIARFDLLTHQFLEAVNDRLGQDKLELDGLHYFRGIAQALRNKGVDVHHSNVPFAEEIDKRSKALAGEIDRILNMTGAARIHLIAHSMGGLDARYMLIHSPGLDQKVRSLTTIGTPHWGSSFADWALDQGGNQVVQELEPYLNLRGYQDLTRKRCREFNRFAEAREAANPVFYQTYASYQEETDLLTLFRAPWEVIQIAEGHNDGVVSLSSQAWTSVLHGDKGQEKRVVQKAFPFRADHYNQIGWWHLEQYRLKGDVALSLLQQMRNYENAVKGIYLSIVDDLRQLESGS